MTKRPLLLSGKRSGALRAALLAWMCLAVALGGESAHAQTAKWPQRPVKLILPFGAGGSLDLSARLLADRLSEKWGWAVVVENRPGADGLLAINTFLVASDDHTLLYASSAAFNAHPYTQTKLPYDRERDLLPIARISNTILSISVPSTSSANTLSEFVALARAEPNKLNVAAAAGVAEFVMGYFLKKQNLAVTRVPYRDIAMVVPDIAADRIQLAMSAAVVMRAMVDSKKARYLAMSSRERAEAAPTVPTVYEAGFPELGTDTTAGVFGYKGMPRDMRDRISKDIISVLSESGIRDRIVASGQVMRAGGPEELAQTLREQAQQMTIIAKELGLKAAVR